MNEFLGWLAQLTQLVKFFSSEGEEQTRCVVLLVGIFDVARLGQDFQGTVYGYGEVFELAAKVFDVELAHTIFPVAHRHLVIVLQMFIYI